MPASASTAAGLPSVRRRERKGARRRDCSNFPTSAGYMPYAPSDAGKTIAQWEVGSYILENFASVDEVRASIGNIVVPSVVFAGWGFAPEGITSCPDAPVKAS